MTSRHLIAILSLMLAAGAAFAAIKQGQAVTPTPVAGCESPAPAIPRVVVTARRVEARQTGPTVARVVVTARRPGTSQLAAANAL